MGSQRTILHSDMNSCYASIELLYHPELRGKPLAVGGDPEARHGIILAKDQLAKKAGVKTGMALWQARECCPDLQIVPPRMDIYLRFSKLAHKIYADYTDLQEAFGLDESWLDVTASAQIKGDGMCIAEEIRQRIKRELGITVSIGVSWNKIFAKFGSDYKKPDAITEITRDNYREIVWTKPVEDLLYVGPATQKKLHRYGIYTIGQLAACDDTFLKSTLGKMGLVLGAFANGTDQTPVSLENASAPIKSIGNSTTTFRDLTTDFDVPASYETLKNHIYLQTRPISLPSPACGASLLAAPPTAFQAKKAPTAAPSSSSSSQRSFEMVKSVIGAEHSMIKSTSLSSRLAPSALEPICSGSTASLARWSCAPFPFCC